MSQMTHLWQVQEEMLGGPDHGRALTQLAAWFPQLYSVDQLAALVTLVAAGVLVRAERTDALHKPVC